MEAPRIKERQSTAHTVWHRSGTARAKELKGTAPPAEAVSPPSGKAGRFGRHARAQDRPVALHTASYTYVFSRLQHHTYRTTLQRAFCEGLYGAPPAEPNSAFYSELDERLRLQTRTLTAVRNKLAVESVATATGGAGGVDTVGMRRDVNSSLSRQMEFFTGCMKRYCGGRPCGCSCQRGEGGADDPADDMTAPQTYG